MAVLRTNFLYILVSQACLPTDPLYGVSATSPLPVVKPRRDLQVSTPDASDSNVTSVANPTSVKDTEGQTSESQNSTQSADGNKVATVQDSGESTTDQSSNTTSTGANITASDSGKDDGILGPVTEPIEPITKPLEPIIAPVVGNKTDDADSSSGQGTNLTVTDPIGGLVDPIVQPTISPVPIVSPIVSPILGDPDTKNQTTTMDNSTSILGNGTTIISNATVSNDTIIKGNPDDKGSGTRVLPDSNSTTKTDPADGSDKGNDSSDGGKNLAPVTKPIDSGSGDSIDNGTTVTTKPIHTPTSDDENILCTPVTKKLLTLHYSNGTALNLTDIDITKDVNGTRLEVWDYDGVPVVDVNCTVSLPAKKGKEKDTGEYRF